MRTFNLIKTHKVSIFLLSIGVAAGAAGMYYLHPNISPFPEDDSALIREVMITLRQNGLGQKETPEKSYGFAAAAGLARYEDRWARLLTKEEAQRLDWVARVGAGSTGIEWRTLNDRTTVASIRADSPAARAGIRPGDVLHSIPGTHHFKARLPISALRQYPPGAAVSLRMWRETEKTFTDYTLTLEKDPESAVQLVSQNSSVAVIEIRDFDLRLERQLFELFSNRFADARPKSLVLDLRGQPGGVTEAARRLAAFFLKPGRLLARTKCANGPPGMLIAHHSTAISKRKQDPKFAPVAEWLQTVPLVIRVDAGTYSASEIVAAGLQDVGRATVEGALSGGKGAGQSAFTLSDGRQLWLTNCEYVTPSRRAIHTIGVVPN